MFRGFEEKRRATIWCTREGKGVYSIDLVTSKVGGKMHVTVNGFRETRQKTVKRDSVYIENIPE